MFMFCFFYKMFTLFILKKYLLIFFISILILLEKRSNEGANTFFTGKKIEAI